MSRVENKPNLFCDLDGTLLDIREKYWALYQEAHTQFGLTIVSRSLFWRCRRSGWSERKVIESRNADGEAIEAYLAFWKQSIETQKYLRFDTMIIQKKWLDLALEHFRLTIVTMRQNKATLDWQLEQLGLSEKVAQIISRASWQGQAPSPSSSFTHKYELLENVFSDPAQDVVIGDTEEDEEMADHYRLPVFLVASGMRTRQRLVRDRAQPLQVYADINHVLSMLCT